jgi:hypothetical protein
MDRKSKLTISRRNFIKTGLLAGAGFLTPGLRREPVPERPARWATWCFHK